MIRRALGFVRYEMHCPCLAPQPVRRERNEPAFVRHTRDFIAGVKGVPPEGVERATDVAARELFGLAIQGGP